MVRKLNLNDNLSPHSCRRFFITEMLKATNGNVPLVAELVGHSSWDMVKHYTKSVINNDSIVNVDFEKLRPRFTI
jgi:site-specific recombinase XerC